MTKKEQTNEILHLSPELDPYDRPTWLKFASQGGYAILTGTFIFILFSINIYSIICVLGLFGGTVGWMLRNRPPDLTFDQLFKLQRVIGQGGQSTVRVARHLPTCRRYAVKCIDKQKCQPRDLVAIRREIAIIDKLRHPNIINLEAAFEDNEHLFAVVELMLGGDCLDSLQSQSRYCEANARKVILAVVQALSFAHSNGVAHRDVKLANVLLSSADSKAKVKLADWGLAKDTIVDGSLTERCGTPDYIAPEIVSRAGPYDFKIDVWSTGVLLYLLLVGEEPFGTLMPDRPNTVGRSTLFRKVRSGIVRIPPDVSQTLSTAAKDIMYRMLTVDSDTRISAHEALLHPWVSGVAPINRQPLTNTIDRLSRTMPQINFRDGIFSSIKSKTTDAMLNTCVPAIVGLNEHHEEPSLQFTSDYESDDDDDDSLIGDRNLKKHITRKQRRKAQKRQKYSNTTGVGVTGWKDLSTINLNEVKEGQFYRESSDLHNEEDGTIIRPPKHQSIPSDVTPPPMLTSKVKRTMGSLHHQRNHNNNNNKTVRTTRNNISHHTSVRSRTQSTLLNKNHTITSEKMKIEMISSTGTEFVTAADTTRDIRQMNHMNNTNVNNNKNTTQKRRTPRTPRGHTKFFTARESDTSSVSSTQSDSDYLEMNNNNGNDNSMPSQSIRNKLNKVAMLLPQRQFGNTAPAESFQLPELNLGCHRLFDSDESGELETKINDLPLTNREHEEHSIFLPPSTSSISLSAPVSPNDPFVKSFPQKRFEEQKQFQNQQQQQQEEEQEHHRCNNDTKKNRNDNDKGIDDDDNNSISDGNSDPTNVTICSTTQSSVPTFVSWSRTMLSMNNTISNNENEEGRQEVTIREDEGKEGSESFNENDNEMMLDVLDDSYNDDIYDNTLRNPNSIDQSILESSLDSNCNDDSSNFSFGSMSQGDMKEAIANYRTQSIRQKMCRSESVFDQLQSERVTEMRGLGSPEGLTHSHIHQGHLSNSTAMNSVNTGSTHNTDRSRSVNDMEHLTPRDPNSIPTLGDYSQFATGTGESDLASPLLSPGQNNTIMLEVEVRGDERISTLHNRGVPPQIINELKRIGNHKNHPQSPPTLTLGSPILRRHSKNQNITMKALKGKTLNEKSSMELWSLQESCDEEPLILSPRNRQQEENNNNNNNGKYGVMSLV